MRLVSLCAMAAISLTASLGPVLAQESEGTMPSRWVGFGEAQVDHEFETDIDSGGTLSVTRGHAELGALYMKSPRDSIGIAVRYGQHAYDFGGTAGFGGLQPWEDIRETVIAVPYRLGIGADWDLMAIASMQGFAESGTSWDEGVPASGILAMSYRVSDDLKVGGGLGVSSQIEDDVSVFPFLLLDWQITETLALATRGAGRAVDGPQAVLSWQADPMWSLGLGAGHETLRFRLDDSGVAPGGVGEEEAYPVFASLTYGKERGGFQAFVFGGYKLAGELTLEDRNGVFVAGSDYENSPFLGGGVRLTW